MHHILLILDKYFVCKMFILSDKCSRVESIIFHSELLWIRRKWEDFKYKYLSEWLCKNKKTKQKNNNFSLTCMFLVLVTLNWCHIAMLNYDLYPQTFIMLWMSGIITLQEGSTTSIQWTDTLSHVTTLLPASREDLGMTHRTGKKNKQQQLGALPL